MQYNVENLFDTVHQEGKQDIEFTPEGKAQWTPARFKEKMAHLGKVIESIKNADGQSCPDILTFAEVEHAGVLKTFKNGQLKDCNYTTAVIDNFDPDPRGIRTSLLSRLPLAAKPFHHETYKGGRFILEVPLQVGEHVLYVFTNHWKSRSTRPPDTDGGANKRKLAAQTLRKRVQTILENDPEADIIAMGDFNDEPEDVSFKTLGITANPQDLLDETGKIFWESSYDLLQKPAFLDVADEDKDRIFKLARSTFYYEKEKAYNQLDHILLSKGLFDDSGFRYHPQSFQVVRLAEYTNPITHGPLPYHPLTRDDGEEVGPRGASDHFPVLLRLDVEDQ
jgi:hypothetical protein